MISYVLISPEKQGQHRIREVTQTSSPDGFIIIHFSHASEAISLGVNVCSLQTHLLNEIKSSCLHSNQHRQL